MTDLKHVKYLLQNLAKCNDMTFEEMIESNYNNKLEWLEETIGSFVLGYIMGSSDTEIPYTSDCESFYESVMEFIENETTVRITKG